VFCRLCQNRLLAPVSRQRFRRTGAERFRRIGTPTKAAAAAARHQQAAGSRGGGAAAGGGGGVAGLRPAEMAAVEGGRWRQQHQETGWRQKPPPPPPQQGPRAFGLAWFTASTISVNFCAMIIVRNRCVLHAQLPAAPCSPPKASVVSGCADVTADIHPIVRAMCASWCLP
jgi:hypothetical protein